MKRKSLLALFIIVLSVLTLSTQKADARGFVIWGTSEKLKKISELPDSAGYKTDDGKHFDLGVKYTTFHIFWVPLWVTEKAVVCGYIDKDNFLDLKDEDIQVICEGTKIDITGKVKPAFWDSFGGKGVLLIFIGLCVWGFFLKDDKEEEKEQTSNA
jgi:hypothetical protein